MSEKMNIIGKHFVFIFLLTLLLSSSNFGQSKYNFSQFGEETVDFLKQPTNWEGEDWLKLGIISAGTFLLIQTVDQQVRDAAKKDQRYFKSIPIEFGRIWGEGYTPILLSAGFSLHSALANDIRTSKVAFEIGQATLYSGAVIFLLKTAFGRSRPYTDEGITSFSPFTTIFSGHNKSLPSGHSAVAFVLSTVLSRNANTDFLKGLAYLPAALTLISRVYQDHHWVSDTFLGAVLGYLIATWVVDQHKNIKTYREEATVFPISFRFSL